MACRHGPPRLQGDTEAEQQARLAELPPLARDQVLLWLAMGDPILLVEARKMLAPPRPRPSPPRTLPEALERIREDPSFPPLAADWLATAFDDRKSWNGFKARCEEAWRGELPVSRLVSESVKESPISYKVLSRDQLYAIIFA